MWPTYFMCNYNLVINCLFPFCYSSLILLCSFRNHIFKLFYIPSIYNNITNIMFWKKQSFGAPTTGNRPNYREKMPGKIIIEWLLNVSGCEHSTYSQIHIVLIIIIIIYVHALWKIISITFFKSPVMRKRMNIVSRDAGHHNTDNTLMDIVILRPVFNTPMEQDDLHVAKHICTYHWVE